MDEKLSSLMYYRFQLTRKPQVADTSTEDPIPNENTGSKSKYDPPIRSGPFEISRSNIINQIMFQAINYPR